jgi:hypothetical protein
MSQVHETISGQRIEYDDPEPAVARLLKAARAIVDDPKRTTDELVALVYGRSNPILDQTLFPERGAVTKAVLENSVYHVLTDLLARKEAQAKGTNFDRVKAKYTLSVSEAAEQLGVTEDAVRRAIRGRRLPAWVKEKGAYYVNPDHLPLLGEVGLRGTSPVQDEPLEVRSGVDAKQNMLQVKFRGGQVPSGGAVPYAEERGIERWRRVAVITGGHDKLRLWLIEPGPTSAKIEFHGFFVRGKFTIVEKINGSAAARKAWEGFKAS